MVRVRFAPSPTGGLHIGGVRTALYNFLFAKQNKGTMILRIEDTDQSRFVPGAEEYIKESLQWIGIQIDEGDGIGGKLGPYRQSDRHRLGIYKQYAQRLLEEKKAYIAFDTEEELQKMREDLQESHSTTRQYNADTRKTMKNSLTLSHQEVEKRIRNGERHVIRLQVPENEDIIFYDVVREKVIYHSSVLDDKVLIKSDGMPTYHFANVVDDHLMEITHVIRGEEWLSSTPIHVLLYDFFGWRKNMPVFVHLPLILKPEGAGKLSKRDAENHGFSIFPLNWIDPLSHNTSIGFRESGYLKETMINFLALLGWSNGTEEEFFTLQKLITEFSLEKVHKSGARFDIKKAQWFNKHYIKQKNKNEIYYEITQILLSQNIPFSEEKIPLIVESMIERITFIPEIITHGMFFFYPPEQYDNALIQKKWNPETKKVLQGIALLFEQNNSIEYSPEQIHSLLENYFADKQIKMGKYMQMLRVAITGSGEGPDLMNILSIIGVPKAGARIYSALQKIGKKEKTE